MQGGAEFVSTAQMRQRTGFVANSGTGLLARAEAAYERAAMNAAIVDKNSGMLRRLAVALRTGGGRPAAQIGQSAGAPPIDPTTSARVRGVYAVNGMIMFATFALYFLTVMCIFLVSHGDITNRAVTLNFYKYSGSWNSTNCDIDGGQNCVWGQTSTVPTVQMNAITALMALGFLLALIYLASAAAHTWPTAWIFRGVVGRNLRFVSNDSYEREWLLPGMHIATLSVCSVIALNMGGARSLQVALLSAASVYAMYMGSLHLATRYSVQLGAMAEFDRKVTNIADMFAARFMQNKNLVDQFSFTSPQSVGSTIKSITTALSASLRSMRFGAEGAAAALMPKPEVLGSGASVVPADAEVQNAMDSASKVFIDTSVRLLTELPLDVTTSMLDVRTILMQLHAMALLGDDDPRLPIERAVLDFLVVATITGMWSASMWIVYVESHNFPAPVYGMFVVLQIWVLIVSFTFYSFAYLFMSGDERFLPLFSRVTRMRRLARAGARGATVGSADITAAYGARREQTTSFAFLSNLAAMHVAIESLVLYVMYTAFTGIFVVHYVSNQNAQLTITTTNTRL